MNWTQLADEDTIEKTTNALRGRGFEVIVAANGEEAKKKVLEIIPKKAEVMNMTSITLTEMGLAKEIEESGEYDSVRKRIMSISDEKERNIARKHALSPDWAIGSIQAITENGEILAASATGSQLAPYVFGAANVIWVVSTKKIVKDMDTGLLRIREYILPLESERVNKAYNMTHGSSVNKILIFEHERAGRIRIILVKENLGF